MASVVALMVSDYWLLTKGNVFVAWCYDGSRSNQHYYYTKGWNVQAVIAYICGIALPFPGFVGSLGANTSTAADDLGHMGWVLSFAVTFIVYYLICQVWPTRNQKQVRELGLGWEAMADAVIMAPDGTSIPESAEGRPEDELGVVYESNDGKGAAVDTYPAKYE